MLREIRVYGQLAKFLGRRTFKAAVCTAAEAVRFLIANFPELEKHMAKQYYRVDINKRSLSFDNLHDPIGNEVIRIIPVLGGAGGSGSTWAQIGIGAALIGLSFVSFGAGAWAGIGGWNTTAAWTAAGSLTALAVGSALVLGGTAQLLTPSESITPIGVDLTAGTDTGTEGTVLDPQENYSFSGIQNTSRPGVPLPICYGEIIVGSIVISTGTDTIQEAV